ncbi:hypothetical protein M0R04_12530 [Candidatus Dojkabacteria bacterium]|jgi:hypothetical protein|nr:hypothetical protein [Candidatus Dojkabacteria bacterium]
MKSFVLSKSEFEDIKSAENKVTNWWRNGTLKSDKVKLYKIIEVYDLRLKFKKRNDKK